MPHRGALTALEEEWLVEGAGRAQGPLPALQGGLASASGPAAPTGTRPLSATPAAPRPQALPPVSGKPSSDAACMWIGSGKCRLTWLFFHSAGFREWVHLLLFCLCFCHVFILEKDVHRMTPASI